MDFLEKITNDIKVAMKAKDKVALEALRGIKKELIELKTSKGASGEVADEDVLKILQKMVKQRKDSADIFASQGRAELGENELAEADIIAKYLPAQMTNEELEAAVKAIIERTGATSMKEMGKVMGMASKELAGKAEGKEISGMVKSLLG
ncbi:GatB/YqeY domain-containing protein [Marinilabiliaceae bacterium JC017]|nr:GatB/YqeY domain-containing protein [Marinilabiliaceae bacterium JC017]